MFKTIDEYIAKFSGELADRLEIMRSTIQQAVPQATEKISYQMPTFFLNGNLVHFAVQKNHIGFYPAPSAIEMFCEKLKDYKTSKGAVQFPHDLPLPLDLISDMVRFRAKENQNKERCGKKPHKTQNT